jgi:L-ribulose-5-phosphate 4-epimerase
MLQTLRTEVCQANRDLVSSGLVTLTWGNVSGIDRERGLVVIKPSGVAYDSLVPDQIVVVDLDGNRVWGELNPSSDTATHVLLYRHFPQIGGITHTHSDYATAFAQARREIPCLGTTHADHFHGPVPLTRPLTEGEVTTAYEANTGHVIIERFAGKPPECIDARLDPIAMPAVLVAGHAPFTWGPTPQKSVENAIALEAVAKMAVITFSLDSSAPNLEPYVLERHYTRKHGPSAYYGQTHGQTPDGSAQADTK